MRSWKLYERLGELEEEYRTALKFEFRKLVSGSCSRYLDRKIPHLFDGRFWQSDEAGRLEKLEREIGQIRSHLNEPSPGPLVSIVHRFVKQCVDAKDKHDGAEARFAKEALVELDAGSSLTTLSGLLPQVLG